MQRAPPCVSRNGAQTKSLGFVSSGSGALLFYINYMLTNPNQIFQYNGSPITFQKGDSVMVNATQMAKPFSKSAKHWLSNQSTEDYLSELSKVRNLTFADLVIVSKGSPDNGGGTWMHEDVALEFARWLSPAFAIWCNDRIKELLTVGVATVCNDDEAILHAMQVLQQRVEASKQRIQMLEGQTEKQQQEIKQLAPKAEYTDNVLQSVNTYTSTQMSKELGMRKAEHLHKRLKERGVMFKQSGQWMLTAKYCEKEYTKPRTTIFTRSDGSQGTNTITVWTERGRAFLHKIFPQKGGCAV